MFVAYLQVGTQIKSVKNITSQMKNTKKNKYKEQEHRSFINWFISVPAKITRSGHQIELKMYVINELKEKIKEFQINTKDPWVIKCSNEDLFGGTGVNL